MKLDANIVAIVTGGASGLGEATVRELIKAGCKVMIADLSDKGADLAKELGSQASFFKVDVSNEENIQKLITETVTKFGALHILVNSAGIISAGLMINSKGNTIPTKEMSKVLGINVVGTFNATKYAALQMHKQQPLNDSGERGVIINVASVAGLEGQKGQTVYSASKGAIIGMTLPMARDLGKFGIRVVTIAPGVFETPMGASIQPKIVEGLKRSTALDRLGKPVEFAQAVLGICQTSYFTGTIIRLDGGIRLPNF